MNAGHELERDAAPWVERLARTGYAAKGVVYILVGYLALRVAFGGGQTEGTSDALATLAGGTPGRVVLAVIAIGLAGYVVWRAYCAIRDPEGDGTGKRIFYAVTGLLYGGLAIEAARLAISGTGGGDDEAQTQQRTATLMSQPFGQWLVGGAGLAILAYGLKQLYDAWTADLDDHLDLTGLDADRARWVRWASRFGLAARGVVFALMGVFAIDAALSANPSETKGVGGALASLRDQAWGPWLLAAVAAGLVAYGGYNLIRARYRRIQPA